MTSERGELLDVVVVGAGISGLTTAYWLARAGLRVAVLEASERIGGAITTKIDGDWIFELGPNTVIESNHAVTELVDSCGLGGEKLEASSAAKKRFLCKHGRLNPLPGGPFSFLTTPLFSFSAKLRLLREPWIPRPASELDETIAAFVRRRLGESFLENAVGPFVSGVYAGDPERLSVRWATPKIAALERDHGSLIRGAFAKKKGLASGGAPAGKMISFWQGLQILPARLAEIVGDVRTGVEVRKILRGENGPVVLTADGRIHARRVVLAVPADIAARLAEESSNQQSRIFDEIPYAPVAVAALGFRREDISHPLGGFGFLVPRTEKLRILGCLFPSEIFSESGRAPAGHTALSAFAGGSTDPEIVSWSDERILAQVIQELRPLLGLRGEPVVTTIRRWPRAIPQYEVGHGRFLESAKRMEANITGLLFGGNYLGGVSVPDCIRNGAEIARRILTHWGETLPPPPRDDRPYVTP